MDMRLGADLYDSFKKYQGLIIEEFDKIAEEFDFQIVDARRPPEEIQQALRARILPILKEGRTKRISKAAAEKAAAEKAVAEKLAEKGVEKSSEKATEKVTEKDSEPAPVKEPATT
jgi:primosomal protein N'